MRLDLDVGQDEGKRPQPGKEVILSWLLANRTWEHSHSLNACLYALLGRDAVVPCTSAHGDNVIEGQPPSESSPLGRRIFLCSAGNRSVTCAYHRPALHEAGAQDVTHIDRTAKVLTALPTTQRKAGSLRTGHADASALQRQQKAQVQRAGSQGTDAASGCPEKLSLDRLLDLPRKLPQDALPRAAAAGSAQCIFKGLGDALLHLCAGGNPLEEVFSR